jgi:hypothetical protein
LCVQRAYAHIYHPSLILGMEFPQTFLARKRPNTYSAHRVRIYTYMHSFLCVIQPRMWSPCCVVSTRARLIAADTAFVTVSASQWNNLLEICTCLPREKYTYPPRLIAGLTSFEEIQIYFYFAFVSFCFSGLQLWTENLDKIYSHI